MFELFAKKYPYIGAEEYLKQVDRRYGGTHIKCIQDIFHWIALNDPKIEYDELTVIYTILSHRRFYIMERHNEHVVCAFGRPVLAAGEVVFLVEKNNVQVESVSNHSVGYCPEPKSWKHVAKSLNRAGIQHPGKFTSEFEFRRCAHCDSINVIKDDWFVCSVCELELDRKWNIAK